MNEDALRNQMARLGAYLSARGYSPGSSGNISVRLSDGFLMTPTRSRMGMLVPERISRLDDQGRHVDGAPPSKEVIAHLAFYRARPKAGAVVHLHSPSAMTVSCLADLNTADALPPLTPYYIMRVGRLPVLPYYRPGDASLAEAVEKAGAESHALLLAHHGLIVCGKDLEDGADTAEELETAAQLYLSLRNLPYQTLNETDIRDLRHHFPNTI